MCYKLNISKSDIIPIKELERLIQEEFLLPKCIYESENSFGEYLFMYFQVNPDKFRTGEIYFVKEKFVMKTDPLRSYYKYDRTTFPSGYHRDNILISAYGIGYNWIKDDYDMINNIKVDISNSDISGHLKKPTIGKHQAIQLIFTHRARIIREQKEHQKNMSKFDKLKSNIYDDLRTLTCEDSLIDINLDQFVEEE